jgi:putative tryptophan/tyrosine transport system substrate-binding protein
MRRREFILVLGTAMALPLASLAQQEKKVFRIGYLSAPTRESVQRPLEVFLRKLRELGWVEGENFIIEYRWAEGNIIRLPELASELVKLNVDLIVAPATPAAVAAKNATSRIPIVMTFPGDPVELGLVSSLSQPGGNVTGTTAAAGPGIIGKLLEILKQAVPHITAVAILGNSADPGLASQMKELRVAAESLSLRLQLFESRGREEFDYAFAEMTRARMDGLAIMGATFVPHRAKLAELAMTARLPVITFLREFTEAGALLSYGVNMSDFIGRAAVYVDRILKGARPADLAVEQPTKFELLINLKTAKALGLEIPPALLARADEVIE